MIVSDEVRTALDEGRGVVALESTIIAHGFPYPDNLELAGALEQAVRDAGAIPATIAVLGGHACVGLDDSQLQRLADPEHPIAKAGAADLAACMSRSRDAATTVSGTATLAALAGIRTFATGGIGGVHRGDASDVSSDLGVVARTPITVVSSGPKAILDLPRTLETLETLGVLVLGIGTDELPAFYTRTSGLALEHRVDEPHQVAEVMRLRFDQLGQGGILAANPIPVEHELAGQEIDALIDEALDQARTEGIAGKALTPFLLSRIAAGSAGEAVRANRALALCNARLAAAIAVAYEATRVSG